ncbi:MAG: DNA-damage-inducible protein F [uncultured Nocardioidaceae bacterium]|uniref:DNA-damage-inducible protein F n=1 Tax=uncultured Nocardioidaceae bacterium TaxID=253824 RepID=A0A6J4LIZ3_9ACTN|nr:MAG: DNA-damage-inducible protein F [uncultured Nocardioidaceae bacterium]
MPAQPPPTSRQLAREVLALAVPAFVALVAEPLFLLADAAVIGHLGTTELAGLGIGAVVLRAAVGSCVFLAYATTAAVARLVGAGDAAAAWRQGVAGLWLAAAVGLVGTVLGLVGSTTLVGAFDPGQGVAAAATTYLRLSWLGFAPMLVVLAATGVLRGFSDARTPLLVAVVGNAVNIGLDVLLVYGVGMGIAGSALGTVVAQGGSAIALTAVVVRRARGAGVLLRPDTAGVRRAARAGGPLVVRTLSLQAGLLVMTWCAARLGATAVATHQLAMTIWTFLAFALDAVAIAAQTLTGAALGAGDVGRTRATTDWLVRVGLVSGVVTGVLLALAAPVLGPLFTDDPAVVDTLAVVLVVAALFQPVAGVVFVLDGVLIGAGDGRWLAVAGTLVTACFAPAAVATAAVLGGGAGGDGGADGGAASGTAWLWAVFGLVFMGGRGLALVLRARSASWMVTGAVR